MKSIKNIRLKQYLNSNNQFMYDALLSSVKAKDSFIVPFDLEKLTYNDVRKIQQKLSNLKTIEGLMEVFCIAYKCKESDFWNMGILEFYQTKKFLIEKIVSLQKKEKKLLDSVDEQTKMYFELAGGKSLNKFGVILPLDRIAKLYGGYPLDYGEKKYIEILYLLNMNNVLSDVEIKMNKLRSQTNKK